jgi:hypothetical protein
VGRPTACVLESLERLFIADRCSNEHFEGRVKMQKFPQRCNQGWDDGSIVGLRYFFQLTVSFEH